MLRHVVPWVGVVVVASLLLSAAPETITVDGGQITGTASDGVRVFKGIPFAAPPIGDLRWRAPEPVVAWSGVKSADTFGPHCMQQPYPAGSPYATAPAPATADRRSAVPRTECL